MLKSISRHHSSFFKKPSLPDPFVNRSSGTPYRATISFPAIHLNKIPLAVKIAAGVVGVVWISYSGLYFGRVRTCESALQQVHPPIPKVECNCRKSERQLFKDLLSDVPSGLICVQDSDPLKTSEFLLSILSSRPASIRIDAQRWKQMTAPEIATELSSDLRIYHIFTKQKLQELLSTFWNIRSDAGGLNDLTVLLQTTRKALEEIKRVDPTQHLAPVIYVSGLTETSNVPSLNESERQWELMFHRWCLEIANDGLAHVVFATKLDDANLSTMFHDGSVKALNVLTLSDLSTEDVKQVLLHRLRGFVALHPGASTAPSSSTSTSSSSSASKADTVQIDMNGTVIKKEQRSEEPVQQEQAPQQAQNQVLNEEELTPEEDKLQRVVNIVADFLGGDGTSLVELTDLARTFARSHRMKSSAGSATGQAPQTYTVTEMDLWLLESLEELVRRHWLRTVNVLCDLYDVPLTSQPTKPQPQARSSIVTVSSQRIRLLYALRELSLHGAIPAAKFRQTLLEGDEELFRTLLSRQVIRLKLAGNALPLTRVSNADESVGHLQVVCGSEIVRRALQYTLLLSESPATKCLHQLPTVHASLQKISDPSWVGSIATDNGELQLNLHGDEYASNSPNGLSQPSLNVPLSRRSSSNAELRQWVNLQTQLTAKLGSWLSSSPTASQWREILHSLPAQYGVAPNNTQLTESEHDSVAFFRNAQLASSINKLAAYHDGVAVRDVQQLLASVCKFYTVEQVDTAMKYLESRLFDRHRTLDAEDIIAYLENPVLFERRLEEQQHFADHSGLAFKHMRALHAMGIDTLP